MQETFSLTTILVFSDSHHRISGMEKIIASVPHNRILFLGDVEDDIRMISRLFPQEKIITVTGNNDFLPEPQYEKIFREDNLSLLVCHGHKYNVKQTLLPLSLSAKQKNCQAALFGHTHRQFAEYDKNGILLLNPGSVGCRGEYAVLRLDRDRIDYRLHDDA